MPKLCCFLHPDYTKDENRALTDQCPQCQRQYGFPLVSPPSSIGRYRIVRPIDRGFYSVAYVAESGPFNRRKVIKVAFKQAYDFFGKDFEQECKDHSRIAEGSQHIVGIDDMLLDERVQFGGEEHVCHVAELDFVEGKTLSGVLAASEPVPARTIAQIAIDLFAILRELENKGFRHNDLQPANLIVQALSPESRRADAEDETIRLVAIDLNSASDESKSDPAGERLGDLHWVVKYLKALVARLLSTPDKTTDLEYRLAAILDERASLLSPDSAAQRTPTYDECIEDIRSAIRHVSSPWREQPKLRRFNDAYNAQTLAAWFVPYLIVDLDDRWLTSISTSGPQVVTGMRGCGKTMLLRSLQFHARATLPTQSADREHIFARLRSDRYIGLYASSTRLLDSLGTRADALVAPYVRLFVQYAVEAIRAIRHLREICSDVVVPLAFAKIGDAVASYVKGAEAARNTGSEYELERYLLELMVRLSRGEAEGVEFAGHPSSSFPHLAEAVSSASRIWDNATVFFLLDDVSTRYLEKPGIEQLMSALLFSDPKCAFKLTTEAQTLEMILRSPGQIEKAREGRDYQVFDLGAEVNALIRAKRGNGFVEQVLSQRAKYYAHHPPGVKPSQILADTPLESIAQQVATTSENSSERKKTYYGMSALAGVCVGDIGDVISLYELMLRKSKGGYPIEPQTQSECYQEYCSRRLYDLNRRKGWLKDHALAFADASHTLLMKSEKDFKTKKITKRRLRQYLKLYVRVTAGDAERQFEQLRELIDAGVFVLDGGAHRTKTRDTNPVQQFKLTYRKLYGLSNFIGLSERDRFELSGEDLINWLDNPAQGKDVLLRNLASVDDVAEVEEMETESNDACDSSAKTETPEVRNTRHGAQRLLFGLQDEKVPGTIRPSDELAEIVEQKTPKAARAGLADLGRAGITTVVLGLGFEERTLESARRIRHAVQPKNVILVRYPELGKSDEIRKSLWPALNQSELDYQDTIVAGVDVPHGNTLVDITGLAKPVIFHTVRNALRRNGRVWVCRTRAASYYPLDEDIAAVLDAEVTLNSGQLLESLSKVLTGENRPYSIDSLLLSDSDESRRRVLCTFSSPKHERLLTLLDERSYEAILVMTHQDGSPRAKMAGIAADLAARNYSGTVVESFSSDDLQGVLSYITRNYQDWYVDQGFNFEFGLTGSKLQAVACAAASAAFKISQCWYVRPAAFDPQRFTKGVGATTVFELSLS
ncbi:MAG: hypothetical protein U1A77_08700 [Pirellulales bacterium]